MPAKYIAVICTIGSLFMLCSGARAQDAKDVEPTCVSAPLTGPFDRKRLVMQETCNNGKWAVENKLPEWCPKRGPLIWVIGQLQKWVSIFSENPEPKNFATSLRRASLMNTLDRTRMVQQLNVRFLVHAHGMQPNAL